MIVVMLEKITLTGDRKQGTNKDLLRETVWRVT